MNNSANESVVQRCAEAIIDRGYGRPAQAVMVEGNPDKPIEHHLKVEFVHA